MLTWLSITVSFSALFYRTEEMSLSITAQLLPILKCTEVIEGVVSSNGSVLFSLLRPHRSFLN